MMRAAIFVLALGACDRQSPQMKECLGMCASAEAQASQCSGPEAEQCKKELADTANECRQLCQEHVK